MKKTLRARRRRRRRALLAAVALLLCLGGVSLVSAIVRLPVHSVPDAPLTDGEPEKTSPEKKENTQEKEASPEDGEQTDTFQQEIPQEEEPSPPPETPYDYSQPVPESAPGAEGDFHSSLFIGNSITDGIARYGIIPGATVYAKNGLTVTNALTEPVVVSGSGRISVEQALGSRQFDRIYLMFGMNELGFGSEKQFVTRYSALIDRLWAMQPSATIYVQSILPVTAERSQKDSTFNIPRLQHFNELIRQMCAEKHALFLDAHSALCDETGALPAEYSSDGIHITKEAYGIWFSYVNTHIWGR